MDAAFQEKILQLAAEGRITSEEGAQLLRTQAPKRFPRVLWSPFDVLPPRLLQLLAALALGGSLLASLGGTSFNGTLDLHFHPQFAGWRVAGIELGVLPALSSLVLWAVALLPARGTRLQDLYVNFLVARIPQVLLAAPCLLAFQGAVADPVRHVGAVLALALLSLPFLAWNIVLMVQGIRNATGLKGATLGLVAGGGILGAEIATKLLLIILH